MSKRLGLHWKQTYFVVGLSSTAFIILATFGIQPTLRLPAWLVGILSPIILSEYAIFTTLLHRKTHELYDGLPCKTRLIVLRVGKARTLKLLVPIAAGLVLFAVGFLDVSSPLIATLPYYVSLNFSYLTRFRIASDKELQTAFDSLESLSTLSRFYQSMTLGLIFERLERVVRNRIPLARKIDAGPMLRALYIGYTIPGNSAKMKDEVLQLKEALSKGTQDIFTRVDDVSRLTAEFTIGQSLSFQLPWEGKINWSLVLTILFGVFDVIGTLAIIENSGAFSSLFHLLLGR